MSQSVPHVSLSLRPYQQRIVDNVIRTAGNAVVVLPTGAGKTLIAAEVMKRHLPASRCLFLVPTCLLVEQQAAAIQSHLGPKVKVVVFMGGLAVPAANSYDVLVCTPKVFHDRQLRGQLPPWSGSSANGTIRPQDCFGLVIFDEVHHVLKQHPYRVVAHSIQRDGVRATAAPSSPVTAAPPSPLAPNGAGVATTGTSLPVRILGLSASLTYEVDDAATRKALSALTVDLNMKLIETASKEELQASGYHGNSVKAELAFPPTAMEGVVPEAQREPENMLPAFLKRVRAGETTPIAKAVYELVLEMEQYLEATSPSWKSPRTSNPVSEWGEVVHKQASKARGPLQSLLAGMEQAYEALRIIITSWEEQGDDAIIFLHMMLPPALASVWPESIQRRIPALWSHREDLGGIRFDNLKDVLLNASLRQDFRCILFVHKRVTTHIVKHFIDQDAELRAILRTAVIHADKAPATPSLGVTKRQVQDRLAAFAKGEINVLIATVVAEEGMDVPQANCVIRFDPMIHSVSLVQGRGRARQADSDFVILGERQDRPVRHLEQCEQLQHKLIQQFDPAMVKVDVEGQKTSQRARERSALSILSEVAQRGIAAAFHLYCSKTKVTPTIQFCKASKDEWRCDVGYDSVLRQFTATATARGKKEAENIAMTQVLTQLAASAVG